jgi:GTP-binding protein Era
MVEMETGDMPQPGPDSRCGFVALIGAPNSGKSTLINRLVGAKVSIVTHKVQTTRARLRGVAIEGASQLVLVDTPGIFAPKRRLDRAMIETAWGEARDADIVAVLIDSQRGLDAQAEPILAAMADLNIPRVLVLNKIDKVEKSTLLALAGKAGEAVNFAQVFMISALTGEGVDDLKRYFADSVSLGPWLYPEDQITDAPLRQAASEITREKMILRLHQELPYVSTVETTAWRELKDGGVRIEQTIYVERDSQKKIVIGAQGGTIKEISMAARKEIGNMLGVPVHLFLFVKVRSSWGDDPERYREMGLEFPKA